jgi:hypothetical protein
MITPSRLVPELDTKEIDPWYREEGLDKLLVAGLRIVAYEDGRIDRADERFPNGAVQAVPLPERLGGGYVFYQSDGQGTRLWRAESWTGRLTALSNVDPTVAEVLPGFDRLYLRTRQNTVFALSADTGAIMARGPLPPTGALGAMTFADGWRAVVDTELRGPLASFDAGASWWPLGIAQTVDAAATVDGDPVLYVDDGYFRLDVAGHLQLVRRDVDIDAEEDVTPPEPEPDRRAFGLGKRPLRTAILRGIPMEEGQVVVLHEGVLARVEVPSGKVLRKATDVLTDEGATCYPARVGSGAGFVCGVERGPTSIHAFDPPLALREVARFPEPRFVSPGGTGALAVRGSCAEGGGAEDDMRAYCVVSKDGSTREIAVRGEIGAERVVALDDGRVVVLVPPRLGRPGRITVISGSDLTSHELKYPDEPRRTVKVARRGLWLEGFEQRGDDAIGGWIEAGGPVVGVEVGLDGEVKLGELLEDGGELLVSGSLGVVISDAETAQETTDGGKSWTGFVLPDLPESQGDALSRGCSRVGCALRGWLRLGWGEPAVKDDLEAVDLPASATVRPQAPGTMRFDCGFVSADDAKGGTTSVGSRAPMSSWPAFHGVAPPRLGEDHLGVDKGTKRYDPVPAHVYVWGGKGADWTRAGWWLLRFDDRFATTDSVRSAAPTRSPWSDETAAAEAIGVRNRGNYWRWEVEMDPGGRGAIANLCAGSRCQPFSVSAGRPILPLSPAGGATYHKPVSQGAVRVGETWYLLSHEAGSDGLELWRSSLGTLRRIAELRRLDARNYPRAATPRLVRRAHGTELGLLVVQPPDLSTGSSVGRWLVLPIDVAEGSLGEPIVLGPVDLDGQAPRGCEGDDDGWLVVHRPDATPSLRLRGVNGYVDDLELRLRLEPGSACVDAIAGQASRGLAREEGVELESARAGVPFAVRERYAGSRWHLRCQPL